VGIDMKLHAQVTPTLD